MAFAEKYFTFLCYQKSMDCRDFPFAVSVGRGGEEVKIVISDKSAEVPNNRNVLQNTVFVASVFTLASKCIKCRSID